VALIVSGTVDGWPVCFADYSYSTGNGENKKTHDLIVTAVRLAVSYPPVSVQPRGGISRPGKAIFGEDAASTGHADFDRQFLLRTNYPTVGRALVGPALIAEQLAGHIPVWSVAGQDLLAWQPGRIDDTPRTEALAAGLVRVAALIGH
jgi:hypothetical protein